MYLKYFGFNDYPFTLSPNPEFLYLSDGHKHAKSYMDFTLYKRDSFVVITGEIGSGKTTLIENMLAQTTDKLVIARIHQTQLDEIEVLQAIAEEFGIFDPRNKKVTLLKKIKAFMLEQHLAGKHCIIVFDEAQNLSLSALEEIRLLSDIEYKYNKVVNILLVGQSQLNELIEDPDMEQLKQRIRLRFHLGKLDLDETDAYIQTRLSLAGSKNTELFSEEITSHIYQHTQGTPRRINVLCDTILTAAFSEEEKTITGSHLISALNELGWNKSGSGRNSNSITPSQFNRFTVQLNESGSKVRDYHINMKTCVIGRSTEADIVLPGSRVSSIHAQIVSNENSSHLIDLGSTNGCKVNNQSVSKHWLEHNDVIQIGKKFELIFKDDNVTQEI